MHISDAGKTGLAYSSIRASKRRGQKEIPIYALSNCFDADVVVSGGRRWRTRVPVNSWYSWIFIRSALHAAARL